MWLNALAAIVLAACIAAGAWSGGLATGLRIVTLVLAYAAAAVLGPAFAPQFGARFGVGGPLDALLSGSAMFVVAYFVLGIAARFAKGFGPRENTGRSPRDRFLGATFGAVRGTFLAIMIVYLAMWFDALRATGNATVLPEIGDSVAADVTSGVVQRVIESAVDTSEPGARFTAHFAANPADSAVALQAIFDDPAFTRLREDERFWNDVVDGNLDAALQRASFFNVAGDAQLRQRAANLGLVSAEAAIDADQFRQSIAAVLEEIGPRLRGLQNDPAVRDLLADPAVVAMLENGDTLGLLAHPKFRELVSRVTAAPGS
jgi:uncharacterized membrane protein required for colicin V production